MWARGDDHVNRPRSRCPQIRRARATAAGGRSGKAGRTCREARGRSRTSPLNPHRRGGTAPLRSAPLHHGLLKTGTQIAVGESMDSPTGGRFSISHVVGARNGSCSAPALPPERPLARGRAVRSTNLRGLRVGSEIGGVRLRTALARQGLAELALEVVIAVAVGREFGRLGLSRLRTFWGCSFCGHRDLLGSGSGNHSLSCRARYVAPVFLLSPGIRLAARHHVMSRRSSFERTPYAVAASPSQHPWMSGHS